jgi:phosphatidylserine/phosphatidylglycerophosphate/cardiolipin synthase-like enzyme
MARTMFSGAIYSFLLCVATPAWAAIMDVCFVPGENCTSKIVEKINAAQTQVLVQAYNFTSVPILEALGKAKDRGVDVEIILDKSNLEPKYNGAKYVASHNIPVWIDTKPAIAHNKLIIIDGKNVIGGSFNYTMSAQKKNAENVTFAWDDSAYAQKFIDNWKSRQAISVVYTPPDS